MALALGAADIAFGVRVPHPGKQQGVVAVDLVTPGLPLESADLVVRIVLPAQLDPTQRIYNPGNPGEADFDIVIHAQTGEFLDCGDQQRRPAPGIRGVELIRRIPRNINERIARQRNHGGLAVGGAMHQNHGVGALPLDRAGLGRAFA